MLHRSQDRLYSMISTDPMVMNGGDESVPRAVPTATHAFETLSNYNGMNLEEMLNLYCEISELVSMASKKLSQYRYGDPGYTQLHAVHAQMLAKRDNCVLGLLNEIRRHPQSIGIITERCGDGFKESFSSILPCVGGQGAQENGNLNVNVEIKGRNTVVRESARTEPESRAESTLAAKASKERGSGMMTTPVEVETSIAASNSSPTNPPTSFTGADAIEPLKRKVPGSDGKLKAPVAAAPVVIAPAVSTVTANNTAAAITLQREKKEQASTLKRPRSPSVESSAKRKPNPKELKAVSGYPQLTPALNAYLDKIRVLKGHEAVEKEAKKLIQNLPIPVGKHRFYSDNERDDMLMSIEEKLITFDQAKRFVSGIIHQQEKKSPKEISKVVSLLMSRVNKDHYGTDFDLRTTILESVLDCFRNKKEAMSAIGLEMNSMKRLGNWIRFDLRNKTTTNNSLYLRFLSSLDMITEQLVLTKLMDVLKTMMKRCPEWKTSIQNLIVASQKREKELNKQQSLKDKTTNEPSTNSSTPSTVAVANISKPSPSVPKTSSSPTNLVPAPQKNTPLKFSIVSYLTGQQKKRISPSAETTVSSSTPIEEEQTRDVSSTANPVNLSSSNDNGLRSILKKASSTKPRSKTRVTFKDDDELVQIKEIPMDLETSHSTRGSSMVKDMEHSEGQILKNMNGIQCVESDVEWRTPRRINFDETNDFERQTVSVVRGGTKPLLVTDDTDSVARPNSYESRFSPFEQNEKLITAVKYFNHKNNAALDGKESYSPDIGQSVSVPVAQHSEDVVMPQLEKSESPPVKRSGTLERPWKVQKQGHSSSTGIIKPSNTSAHQTQTLERNEENESDDELMSILADGDSLVNSHLQSRNNTDEDSLADSHLKSHDDTDADTSNKTSDALVKDKPSVSIEHLEKTTVAPTGEAKKDDYREREDEVDDGYDPDDLFSASNRQSAALNLENTINKHSFVNTGIFTAAHSRSGELPPPHPQSRSRYRTHEYRIDPPRKSLHSHPWFSSSSSSSLSPHDGEDIAYVDGLECAAYPQGLTQEERQRCISPEKYELRCHDVRSHVRLTSPFDCSKYTRTCIKYNNWCPYGSKCFFIHPRRT